jgi:hypothetical protein
MGRASFLRAHTLLGGLFTLLALGGLLHEVHGQTTIESSHGSAAQVILEVKNKHFTVGRKIPSVYLRVFSDRSVECHSLKYTGDEVDIVKKKTLTPDEFERVRALVDQPELLNVRKRYGLMRTVVDSWMEWDIKLQHAGRVQNITVAAFSPRSARGRNRPYPDALVKLGCSISTLRDEVCSYEPGYQLRDECEEALQNR